MKTKPEYREISLGFTDEKFREGHHIVYVYNDDWERKRTMACFLKQGMIEQEKVLYLADEISPEEMKKELQDLGVDCDNVKSGFTLSTAHYTLCPGQLFSRDYMLGMVAEYYDNAINEGFAGARGAGEMSWALVEGRCSLPDLLEYEAELNEILCDHPLTTVCQYDANRFDGAIIMDMLSVHPMMIIRGQLVKNPLYIEPNVFLAEYHERQKRKAGKHSAS